MSAEVLTLRDLDAPPSTAVAVKPDAALAPAPVTIKSAVLALFKPMEAELQALAKRHENVAYDMSTPKGLAIAKASRHELRESGRFAVQRLRDKTKEQLNDGKKVVESEADRLIAIVKPVEDHVHGQIEASEQQLAAEKAVRDRIEAKRIARHADAIAVIAGYVDQAHGKPSDKIAAGIDYVQTIDVGAEVFEEFAAQAGMVKIDTLAKLLVMHENALRDEADAAERERQRVENARVAAELAEQKRLLDEQAAALKRQAEEIEAARQRAVVPAAVTADLGTGGLPAPCEREAPPNAPAEEGNVPLPGTPGAYASSGAEAAQDPPSGDEGPAAHAEERAAEPALDAEAIPVLPAAIVVPDIGELLAACFAFTKYAAAPFFSDRVRVVDEDGAITYIQPTTQEWWSGLRDDIERLQPLLEQAIAARKAA